MTVWAGDKGSVVVVVARDSVSDETVETAPELCHKQRKEGKDYQDIDRSDQTWSSRLPARI